MIGNPSKKGMVERYTVVDPLTGSDVLMYKWKYCRAMTVPITTNGKTYVVGYNIRELNELIKETV